MNNIIYSERHRKRESRSVSKAKSKGESTSRSVTRSRSRSRSHSRSNSRKHSHHRHRVKRSPHRNNHIKEKHNKHDKYYQTKQRPYFHSLSIHETVQESNYGSNKNAVHWGLYILYLYPRAVYICFFFL